MQSQRYLDILDWMKAQHARKSAGYSGVDHPDPWRNFRMAEQLGVPAYMGALIRASDKFSRIGSLVRDPGNDQVGEGLIDTALDGAAYLIIFAILYDEWAAGQGVSTGLAGMTGAEPVAFLDERGLVGEAAEPRGDALASPLHARMEKDCREDLVELRDQEGDEEDEDGCANDCECRVTLVPGARTVGFEPGPSNLFLCDPLVFSLLGIGSEVDPGRHGVGSFLLGVPDAIPY